MCRSMVDIQSATAEIRRGKKEERKIETIGRPATIIKSMAEVWEITSNHGRTV